MGASTVKLTHRKHTLIEICGRIDDGRISRERPSEHIIKLFNPEFNKLTLNRSSFF